MSGWSPVTMMTRMPARWQVATAWGTVGRGGSISEMRPMKHSLVVGKLNEDWPSSSAGTISQLIGGYREEGG